MELTDRQLAVSQRYGNSFVLALADLDLFKTVNDTYGHHAGDRVLRHFSLTCGKNLRESDIVGRIGGEEFAIMLPNASLAEAQVIIERLRMAVAEADIDVGQSSPIGVTVSFGLADWFPEDSDVNSLLRRADAALYEAKKNGRNRVCVAKEEFSPPGERQGQRTLQATSQRGLP